MKCPFHGGGNERTPSCKLDDARGTFYCFGCHESGDIFSLVMKKEGVDRVSLTTDYYNNESAVGFYHSMGYETLYEFVTYPNRKMYRLIKTL